MSRYRRQGRTAVTPLPLGPARRVGGAAVEGQHGAGPLTRPGTPTGGPADHRGRRRGDGGAARADGGNRSAYSRRRRRPPEPRPGGQNSPSQSTARWLVGVRPSAPAGAAGASRPGLLVTAANTSRRPSMSGTRLRPRPGASAPAPGERGERGHAGEPQPRLPQQGARRGDADAQAGEGAGAEADGHRGTAQLGAGPSRISCTHGSRSCVCAGPSAWRSATTEPSAAQSAAEHAVVAVSSARITTPPACVSPRMSGRRDAGAGEAGHQRGGAPPCPTRAARLVRVRARATARSAPAARRGRPGHSTKVIARPEVVVPGEQSASAPGARRYRSR